MTGAARGIGFATARALHDRGASVAVLDLDQAAAGEAADCGRRTRDRHRRRRDRRGGDALRRRHHGRTVGRAGHRGRQRRHRARRRDGQGDARRGFRAGPRREPDRGLPNGRSRPPGGRRPGRAHDPAGLDLLVLQRSAGRSLRHEQGGSRGAGPCPPSGAGRPWGQRRGRLLRLHRHRDGAPGHRGGSARRGDGGSDPRLRPPPADPGAGRGRAGGRHRAALAAGLRPGLPSRATRPCAACSTRRSTGRCAATARPRPWWRRPTWRAAPPATRPRAHPARSRTARFG